LFPFSPIQKCSVATLFRSILVSITRISILRSTILLTHLLEKFQHSLSLLRVRCNSILSPPLFSLTTILERAESFGSQDTGHMRPTGHSSDFSSFSLRQSGHCRKPRSFQR